MSDNPLNLALRFLLEVSAYVALAYWGWHKASGALRYLSALGPPMAAAALWGTFRVPNDSSASGEAPVPVSGPARLLLELTLFGSAVWGLLSVDATTLGLTLAGVVLLHYAISYDRVVWLLKQ